MIATIQLDIYDSQREKRGTCQSHHGDGAVSFLQQTLTGGDLKHIHSSNSFDKTVDEGKSVANDTLQVFLS